jgi:hypothetical protein
MPVRKTFIGRVLSVTQSKVVMSTIDPANGDAIALQAGAVVLERARALVGQVVRYTAEVSEATKCLSNPQFVIGSEYGLVAVHTTHSEACKSANRFGEGFDCIERGCTA